MSPQPSAAVAAHGDKNRGANSTITSLAQLDLLLGASKSLHETQTRALKQTNELEQLRAQVARLRRQRNNLRQRLGSTPEGQLELKDVVRRLAPPPPPPPAGGATENVDVSTDAPLRAATDRLLTTRRIAELRRAYRMVGRTVFHVDATHLGVRFETCYEGEFFERYYLILEYDPRRSDSPVSVHRHILPVFVPLDRIVRNYDLATELAELSEEIFMYLQAFVARREEVSKLATLLRLGELPVALENARVSSNNAFDRVVVEGHHFGLVYVCTLTYEDLTLTRPTTVRVEQSRPREPENATQRRRVQSGSVARRRTRRDVSKEPLFTRLTLVDAVTHAFRPAHNDDDSE